VTYIDTHCMHRDSRPLSIISLHWHSARIISIPSGEGEVVVSKSGVLYRVEDDIDDMVDVDFFRSGLCELEGNKIQLDFITGKQDEISPPPPTVLPILTVCPPTDQPSLTATNTYRTDLRCGAFCFCRNSFTPPSHHPTGW
jgi:hypothetical protein